MLALLAELEAEHEQRVMALMGLTMQHTRANDAEGRITVLEAREVKLPERYEVEMCPTPSPDGEWYSREDVLAALKTAGIHIRRED